jgi:DNA-binding GntR family transcriptional regulator
MNGDSLNDKICNYIIDSVKNGVFSPGSKISENSVCGALGVSRTPVREALTKLAASGMLVKIPRRGFFVYDTSLAKANHLYRLIGVLDALAAELAVENLDEQDYLKMEELIAKLDVAIQFKNMTDYTKFQQDFHFVYINKSGNTILIDILTSIFDTPVPKTYTANDAPLFALCQKCNNEHKIILALLKAGNIAELHEQLLKHWNDFIHMGER